MPHQALLEKINSLEQTYLSVWEDVCKIESPTEYKPGVDAVGNYFVKMAQAKSWQVEISHQEVAGDAICITMNPESKAPAVVLSGHMDTVHPVGSFPEPVVRRDSERIYGPGTHDCKGGITAAFMAMDALDQCGLRHRPVKLILQSDEETASVTSGGKTVEFMLDKAKGAVAFLNAESIANGVQVVLERRGVQELCFEVFGKAFHSARCDLGASAIAEAARKILELEKLKDKDGLTFNCGTIQGGTATNSVPDCCTFYGDIRFATQKEYRQALTLAQQIADTVYVPGCSCRLRLGGYRPSMEKCDRNFQLLEKINRIYRENGMPELTAINSSGDSDASFVTAAGIPCVDSIGISGSGMHTPKEFGLLHTLKLAAQRMAFAAWFLP